MRGRAMALLFDLCRVGSVRGPRRPGRPPGEDDGPDPSRSKCADAPCGAVCADPRRAVREVVEGAGRVVSAAPRHGHGPGRSPPCGLSSSVIHGVLGTSGGERSRRSGSAPSTARLLPPPGRRWPSGRRRGRLASRTSVLARGRSGASWSRSGQFAAMIAANSRSTHSVSAHRASRPRHGPGGGGRLGVLVVITAITSQRGTVGSGVDLLHS